MQRLASLLDPKNLAYSHRQALVRLWVLASDPVRLNSWEQASNDATIAPQIDIFRNQLEADEPIEIQLIETQPLALIRALDDLVSVTTHGNNRYVERQNAYRMQEDGKDYWLVPVHLEARRQAAVNRQPGRLAHWFHRHAVLPAITAHNIHVKVLRSRSALDEVFNQLFAEPDASLKVWMAHFTDGADVEWDTLSPIGNWRSRCVEPNETRLASMLQTLNRAIKAGAHMVVFPEFSLDLQHRLQLTQFLQQNPSSIQLVVAGAFHEPENPENPENLDAPSLPYNTAPVLTATGRQLFAHRKLSLFGKTDFGAEYAQVGNQLHVLVTPIGSMTVLICKDFMDNAPRVDNLLTEVPVDWVWVPSFGDEKTLKAHKKRAKELAKVAVGTSCAVANTQNTPLMPLGPAHNFLPGFGHAGGETDPQDISPEGGLIVFSLAKQKPPAKPVLQRIK
jgi:predicted amidohydrolase